MFKFRKNFFSEEKKYDLHAQKTDLNSEPDLGPYLNLPYLEYSYLIQHKIKPFHTVLELGCGTGERSLSILDTNCNYVGCDISQQSLNKFEERFRNHINFNNIKLIKSEFLNIQNISKQKYDFILGAGILSYIDKSILNDLLSSMLVEDGELIFVDSWNENFIYSANRKIQYYFNNRSLFTIHNMPNKYLVPKYLSKCFSLEKLDFFNNFAWLWPLGSIFGEKRIFNFLLYLDKNLGFLSAPFKIVMTLKKNIP